MGNKIKDLEKCKHPNSRKTIQLTRQLKKQSHKEKARIGQAMKQNLIGEKYVWFKEQMGDCTSCTATKTEELITKYLSRFDEELEQIKLKHSIGMRKNRQHASREDIVTLQIKRETEEFNTCGIEIPDIMNAKNVEAMRKWNGELRFLQNLKLKRFSKKFLHAEKEREAKKNVLAKVPNNQEKPAGMDLD